MRLSDFRYDLPPELIAQTPAAERTASRLLHVAADGSLQDQQFADCLKHLSAGDVLVLNNTKVIPARLFGRKRSGGRVEILLERVLGASQILAQMRASKAPKPGTEIVIDGAAQTPAVSLLVTGRQDNFFILEVKGLAQNPTGAEGAEDAKSSDDSLESALYHWLEQVGNMPLPPYIEREQAKQAQQSAAELGQTKSGQKESGQTKPEQAQQQAEQDLERYQTVFAQTPGAVAAPTAGLHFDDALLQAVRDKGVQIAYVTLHVGAGTYQPVRVENILDHTMHHERVTVTQDSCDVINQAKQTGHKVIAVGTTVVRSLETAYHHSSTLNEQGQKQLAPFNDETNIFIYPGFEFGVIDTLITNFHLSESTLLMLVSAFSGKSQIMQAYQHAIAAHYRFFSYGDAMILERAGSSVNG